ncbi:hypothetical protein DDE18_01445 [Nocardioides gansuensis]|uniref:Glycosyltransferase RgtA/B/C/D-like domain-containing protein n=1 Tax=Nocardioides gansuensis TaxID=2138300 RepID=A0A2T8FF54_9ACTN|nr:hypothetical protein DDE18_01445 [Nocardioides gansuensis]
MTIDRAKARDRGDATSAVPKRRHDAGAVSAPRPRRLDIARFRPAARTVGLAIAYVLGACLLLRPTLTTTVVADDFQAPFALVVNSGPTLGDALSHGWNIAMTGAKFRLVGAEFGTLMNWLNLWVSATFDLPIDVVFNALKLGVFVGCAAAAATFWWLVARTHVRPVRWATAFFLTSTALFGSLQLHALWSNDPVQSFPFAGFGATAVGFLMLTTAVWVAARPSWRRYLAATVGTVAGVSYYELNAGAVLGAGVVLAVAAWAARRDRRRLVLHVVGGSAMCLVPALLLVVARGASPADTYAGRQVRADGAFDFLVRGLLGSLPGGAWQVSEKILQARPGLVFSQTVAVLVVVAAVGLWCARVPELPPADPATRSRAGALAAGGGVVVYALFAVGLQSSTVKVQDEMLGIGYVYMFYAVVATSVALGVAVVTLELIRTRRRAWPRTVALCCAVVFLVFQGTYNMRLHDLHNSIFKPNAALDNAWDEDVPQGERCRAIHAWADNPWPDYYRNDVVLGTDKAYRYYFGEAFCPSARRWVRLG